MSLVIVNLELLLLWWWVVWRIGIIFISELRLTINLRFLLSFPFLLSTSREALVLVKQQWVTSARATSCFHFRSVVRRLLLSYPCLLYSISLSCSTYLLIERVLALLREIVSSMVELSERSSKEVVVWVIFFEKVVDGIIPRWCNNLENDWLTSLFSLDRLFLQYAEQMDIHEGTATLREALRFSAYLRQPASVPKEEKDAWVSEARSLASILLSSTTLSDLRILFLLSHSLGRRDHLASRTRRPRWCNDWNSRVWFGSWR